MVDPFFRFMGGAAFVIGFSLPYVSVDLSGGEGWIMAGSQLIFYAMGVWYVRQS